MKRIMGSLVRGLIICLLLFGCTNREIRKDAIPDFKSTRYKGEITRYGNIIRLKPEKYEFYKQLHSDPWPGVDSMLKVCNIRNYSIYYRDGYLFSYMEYTGNNWKADMEILSKEPIMQEWWKLTDPCQEPVESAGDGEWWVPMEELYHLD